MNKYFFRTTQFAVVNGEIVRNQTGRIETSIREAQESRLHSQEGVTTLECLTARQALPLLRREVQEWRARAATLAAEVVAGREVSGINDDPDYAASEAAHFESLAALAESASRRRHKKSES